MEFYAVVLRPSGDYWVALCLENGMVGQGSNQEEAINKLKDAIDSWQSIRSLEPNIYSAAVPIQELHEFLTVESQESKLETYELRKVYA